jgi:hypothetical protein
MSRILKSRGESHRLVLQADDKRGDLIVVGGGKTRHARARRAFVSVSTGGSSERLVFFSGAVALRALAKAILSEVGEGE